MHEQRPELRYVPTDDLITSSGVASICGFVDHAQYHGRFAERAAYARQGYCRPQPTRAVFLMRRIASSERVVALPTACALSDDAGDARNDAGQSGQRHGTPLADRGDAARGGDEDGAFLVGRRERRPAAAARKHRHTQRCELARQDDNATAEADSSDSAPPPPVEEADEHDWRIPAPGQLPRAATPVLADVEQELEDD